MVYLESRWGARSACGGANQGEQPRPFGLFVLCWRRTFCLFERGQVQESEADGLVDCFLGCPWSDDRVGARAANGRGIREGDLLFEGGGHGKRERRVHP